jgi:hypothetical protein
MDTHVGDLDSRDNLSSVQGPESEGVCLLDTQSGHGLENAERNDEIRGEDKVVLEVNTQAVRCELFAKNVELFAK